MGEDLTLNPVQEQDPLPSPEHPKKPFRWKQFGKDVGIKAGMLTFCMLFIVGYQFVFGPQNSMVAVCIVTGLLMFLQVDLGIKTWQAAIAIPCMYLLTAIATHAAWYNPLFGIAIHLTALWLILMLTTEKMVMRAYLPFMLCYIFLDGEPVYGAPFRMQLLALAVGGVLVGILYFVVHRKQKGTCSIFQVFTQNKILSVRHKFVLRMMIGLAASFFIAEQFHFVKGNWIAFAVLSVTQPLLENSSQRMIYRIMGTLIGGLIFTVVFGVLLPPQYTMVGLLIFGFLYQFPKDYRIQQILVAVTAIGGAMTLLEGDVTLGFEMRVFYNIFGVCLVLVINLISQMHLLEKISKLFGRAPVEESHLEPPAGSLPEQEPEPVSVS